MAGIDGLDLALGTGAAGFDFAAGVGSMYIGSGLFWGWAVALGSPSSFPLPSSINKAVISSSFSRGQIAAQVYEIQITPTVDTDPPPWCQSSTLLLDFLPLDEQANW